MINITQLKTSFNSLMVRLKGTFSFTELTGGVVFQFLDGAIKSNPHPTRSGCLESFNSLMVRLKD